MKATQEKGSALHIIIVIILAVAVLGLLGFVFWQNFINKQSKDNTVSTSQQTKSNSTSGSQTLTVSEWGIKGDYSSAKDLQYQYTTDGFGNAIIKFTSPAVTAADDGKCGTGYIESTYRYMGSDMTNIGSGSNGNPDITAKDAYDTITVPNISWDAKAHVGDYYYFMTRPQNSCENAQADALSKVRSAAVEFLLSAKSL